MTAVHATGASTASVRVDVVIDDAWFVRLPLELVVAPEERQLEWARAVVAEREPDAADRQPLAQGARELLAAALADSFRSLTEGSIVALRLVRDGLPGSVLVQVFAQLADLESLDELVDEAPAALPRQRLPLDIEGAQDARIVATVRQSPEHGTVGFLQFQVLRDGVLIEAVAASRALDELGAGMEAVEELVRRIEVAPSTGAAG